MSIYATLWEMRFPRDGWCGDGEQDFVEVYAQAVPAHIQYTGPNWEWLKPPVPNDAPPDQPPRLRAVFICGPATGHCTARNHQEYTDYLLQLTGDEYATMPWPDLWERIAEALHTQPAHRAIISPPDDAGRAAPDAGPADGQTGPKPD